jgi:plastocyanin
MVDGRAISVDSPLIIHNDISLVSLRIIGDYLDAKVDYDENTGAIAIQANQPKEDGMDMNGMNMSAKSPVTISIKNMAFHPAELQIKKGTTVTWVNDDMQTHTVNDLTSLFNSGKILPNTTWSYKFETAGIYDYYCSIHPMMLAKVVVE